MYKIENGRIQNYEYLNYYLEKLDTKWQKYFYINILFAIFCSIYNQHTCILFLILNKKININNNEHNKIRNIILDKRNITIIIIIIIMIYR